MDSARYGYGARCRVTHKRRILQRARQHVGALVFRAVTPVEFQPHKSQVLACCSHVTLMISVCCSPHKLQLVQLQPARWRAFAQMLSTCCSISAGGRRSRQNLHRCHAVLPEAFEALRPQPHEAWPFAWPVQRRSDPGSTDHADPADMPWWQGHVFVNGMKVMLGALCHLLGNAPRPCARVDIPSQHCKCQKHSCCPHTRVSLLCSMLSSGGATLGEQRNIRPSGGPELRSTQADVSRQATSAWSSAAAHMRHSTAVTTSGVLRHKRRACHAHSGSFEGDSQPRRKQRSQEGQGAAPHSGSADAGRAALGQEGYSAHSANQTHIVPADQPLNSVRQHGCSSLWT